MTVFADRVLPRTAAFVLFLLVSLTLPLFPVAPASAHRAETRQSDLPWQDKSSPFGVVAALGNRVREDELDRAVALMREAGVQWQREEIFWERVQKEPGGPFTWDGDGSGLYNYDRAIEAQVQAGVNILGLLDYNPYWFKGDNPPPEAWIEDWGHFVYAAVAHYGRDLGWVKHWELWNEPNLAPFGYESGLYEIEDFVRILEVGSAAAKAADPEAVIVMGGTSGVLSAASPFTYDQLDYIDQVAQLGGWEFIDVVAIHPYHGIAPEAPVQRFDRTVTLQQELEHLDALLRRYGPKPVWITELGWSNASNSPVGADAQAFYLIRAYILTLAHPSVEKFFWYDFRNDTHPDAPYEAPLYNDREWEFHYGLLRRAYPLDLDQPDLRKPSFLAFRTLTQMLSGLTMQPGNLAQGAPGLYQYRFTGGERRVDVFWTTRDMAAEDYEETTLFVECGCEEALVRGWDGSLHHILYTNNGSLMLRPEAAGVPLFIEYDTRLAAAAAPTQRYFAQSGHTLSGSFLQYWEEHGGLSRFGYPLTEEIIEPDPTSGKPRVVQYFERTRFEYFPELAETPFVVQTARLGTIGLERHGIEWWTLPQREAAPSDECLFFAETGHAVCPPFRAAWERYGGVELMGYPLTEPFEVEAGEGEIPRRVQYFERARLEYFAEHAGTPNEVQLGLLVRELFTRYGAMP